MGRAGRGGEGKGGEGRGGEAREGKKEWEGTLKVTPTRNDHSF